MSKYSTDNRDERRGAYDPVTKEGSPQPHQVKDKTNDQREQQGADVRADFITGTEPVLPEGLVRKPKGPLNRRTGRRPTD